MPQIFKSFYIHINILYDLFLFVGDTEGIESYIKPLYKEEGINSTKRYYTSKFKKLIFRTNQLFHGKCMNLKNPDNLLC